ncbi:MAG TPA: VOC family protein [Acidobacteriaceae bacterium]|jgi:catechol 2,3-dioxygenase-like lactoylglutathione lyase family enzyme
MQRLRFHIVLLSLGIFACLGDGGNVARAQDARPKITGISHMAVYTSDPAAADHFYREELGAAKEPDPEDPGGTVYRFSEEQFIEVLPLPAEHSISRLDHVAFATTDAEALHGYFVAHQYREIDAVKTGSDGSKWFFTRDPEGNRVQFYQAAERPFHAAADLVSPHIIHVGFLVKDRAAEDRFYRDLLGFRPYWYGAMHPGKLDWVSQQVPDGHDWVEYMMTGPGSDSGDPSKIDARQLGVMNHFSLGVPNMEKVVTALYVSDAIRFSPRHDGPQMGKDGKWQANLYDPDGTRVELMEFQPVMKPCCSEFTAASPAD